MENDMTLDEKMDLVRFTFWDLRKFQAYVDSFADNKCLGNPKDPRDCILARYIVLQTGMKPIDDFLIYNNSFFVFCYDETMSDEGMTERGMKLGEWSKAVSYEGRDISWRCTYRTTAKMVKKRLRAYRLSHNL